MKSYLALLLLVLPTLALAEGCPPPDPERRAYFGDTHIHTRWSLDASTQGTRTTPDQAYKFARGEALGIQPWTRSGEARRSLQLSRPLDFAMLSDHAELLGEVNICNNPELEGHDSWECIVYRNWSRGAFYLFNAYVSFTSDRLGFCGDKMTGLCAQALLQPWQEIQQAAADNNSDDCSFTTFVGYEWTGLTPQAGNWHRNVMFRNAVVPERPASFIDAVQPARLWEALRDDCSEAGNGCEALSIPHNSNVSQGGMFSRNDDNGEPMTADYARLRAQYEPVMEIMQHKGASECHFEPGVSTDELCAFEQLRDNTLGVATGTPPDAEPGWLRGTLSDGLALEDELGVNPYKLGVIASTDTHLGAPGAADEDRFLGHGGAGIPAETIMPPGLPDKLDYSPGGLAVVWAEQNNRDAIFDAMQRRETYGTSGPRIITRMFGGWEYDAAMCDSADFVAQGYDGGVPMGGELSAGGQGAPRFAVSAQADAGVPGSPGTPLQRIQIIKGWVDAQGENQERVYEVAGNPNNGASVDLKSCQTSGSGYQSLCAVWQDPDFDPAVDAWYYSRVVENPTCRWSQRMCAANEVNCKDPSTIGFGLEGCCADDHRPVIQERAWSSPIWYKAS